MSVLQVRYLTMEDLIELGAARDAVNWSRWAAGSVYPIQSVSHDQLSETPMVECTVVMNYQGETCSIRMSAAKYARLGIVPTHESVADVPRKDMRRK